MTEDPSDQLTVAALVERLGNVGNAEPASAFPRDPAAAARVGLYAGWSVRQAWMHFRRSSECASRSSSTQGRRAPLGVGLGLSRPQHSARGSPATTSTAT
jgi:hypothetical protein